MQAARDAPRHLRERGGERGAALDERERGGANAREQRAGGGARTRVRVDDERRRRAHEHGEDVVPHGRGDRRDDAAAPKRLAPRSRAQRGISTTAGNKNAGTKSTGSAPRIQAAAGPSAR